MFNKLQNIDSKCEVILNVVGLLVEQMFTNDDHGDRPFGEWNLKESA
jgi:hypothetical protein